MQMSVKKHGVVFAENKAPVYDMIYITQLRFHHKDFVLVYREISRNYSYFLHTI